MPRGPMWTAEEDAAIKNAAVKAKDEGKPLSVVWAELSQQFKNKRSPQAIAMHYYKLVGADEASANGAITESAKDAADAKETKAPAKKRGRKPKTAKQTEAKPAPAPVAEVVSEEPESELEESQEEAQVVESVAEDEEWEPVDGEEAQSEEVTVGVQPQLAVGQRKVMVEEPKETAVPTAVASTEIGDLSVSTYKDNKQTATLEQEVQEIKAQLSKVVDPMFVVQQLIALTTASGSGSGLSEENAQLRHEIERLEDTNSDLAERIKAAKEATATFADYYEGYMNLRTAEQMTKYAEFHQYLHDYLSQIKMLLG